MTDDQILVDLYDLNTPELRQLYRELDDLVAKTIIQYDAGMAVDLEQEQADLAKDIVRRFQT